MNNICLNIGSFYVKFAIFIIFFHVACLTGGGLPIVLFWSKGRGEAGKSMKIALSN